jgi:hypothetical protein
MNEVDPALASNHARECADDEINACYAPELRESIMASAQWARAFRREFDALTKPQSAIKEKPSAGVGKD